MDSPFLLSVLLLLLSFRDIAPLDYKIPAPDKEFCDRLVTDQLPLPQNTPRRPTPRVFPLCMGKLPGQNDWASHIENWHLLARILKRVESEHNTKNNIPEKLDPQKHAMSLSQNGGVLKVYSLEDSAGVVLDRTLFLAFDFTPLLRNRGIDIIYLQAIQGPFGFPFGVFHLDSGVHRNSPRAIAEYVFPSNADNNFIRPCTFKVNHEQTGTVRPVVPQVLMWDSDFPNAVPHGTIHQKFGVIFQFNEVAACTQAPFFQFLVVIGYDKNTRAEPFTPFLSNIVVPPADWYNNRDLLPSIVRIPAGARVGSELVGAVKDFHRITPNFDFELCMKNGNTPTHFVPEGNTFSCHRGSGQYSCNPGGTLPPLKANEREREYGKWITAYDRYNSDRPVCTDPPPTTTTTTTTTTSTTITTTTTTTTEPPLLLSLTQKLGEIAQQVEKRKKITHGDLCIYVWYVLFPPANYIARFFKDSQKKFACALGAWIMVHVAAHHIGILLIWISFGLVIASGDNFFSGVGAIHFVFGIGATVFQMVLIFHSMWPRIEKQFTLKDVPVQHVSYGYATWAMTTICIYYSNNITRAKMSMVGALTGVTIVSNLVGMFIEKRIDKYLMVYPPRRYFPELESIAIDGKTPYAVVKRFWFGIYTAILYGLYFWLAFHQKLFTAA